MSDPSEEGGEINIVPFLDIIMNILMFVLATVAITFTSTADVSPPQTTPGHSPKPLGLTIMVVDDGFAIKASGGNVGPGCHDTGAGLAVPKNDFAALHQCVASLKRNAELSDENSVTLSANPGIRYETLVATMDAVRTTDDGKDLFPDVNFAIVR